MGHRRSLPVCAAALVASLVIAAPADAGCGGVKQGFPSVKPPSGRAPLVIGDSVLLGAVPDAARAGYEVNAKGCRQWTEALEILRGRRRAGTLPFFSVVSLGTNGSVSREQLRAALRILGPDRVLGLMTPRELGGGSGSDASLVRAFARSHPSRVQLVDWVAFTAGHGSWFAGDGIHLGPSGAAAMGRLLRDARRAVPPPPCPD